MQMGVMGKARSVAAMGGRILNEAVSFVAFCVLDLVDFLLCFVFKAVDLWVEAEFRPCYCSSAKEAITSSGKILVSEQGGESKIVSLLSSTKLQLEDISDTLYSRPSLVSEVSRLTINELKRLKLEDPVLQSKRGNSRCSTFTVNTTIVEMLQGKIARHLTHPIPRWSDCDCKLCTSWISSSSSPHNNNTNAKATLFLKSQCPTTGTKICH